MLPPQWWLLHVLIRGFRGVRPRLDCCWGFSGRGLSALIPGAGSGISWRNPDCVRVVQYPRRVAVPPTSWRLLWVGSDPGGDGNAPA
jgi:hypothetical protein